MSGAVCLSYVSIRLRTTASRSAARMTTGGPHLSQTPDFFGGFVRMWYTVSSFGQTRRPVFRLISSSGSRKKFTAASSFVNLDSASACAIVRGNPSRMKPFFASGSLTRGAVTEITMSSGTSCPASMYAFAFFPRSVPCATLCRKMLPVEMCGTPRYAASFAAWVPLPAPGGPSRTSLMSRRERSQRSKDFGTHEWRTKQTEGIYTPRKFLRSWSSSPRSESAEKGRSGHKKGSMTSAPQTTNGSWFPSLLAKDPDAFGTATSRICSRLSDKMSKSRFTFGRNSSTRRSSRTDMSTKWLPPTSATSRFGKGAAPSCAVMGPSVGFDFWRSHPTSRRSNGNSRSASRCASVRRTRTFGTRTIRCLHVGDSSRTTFHPRMGHGVHPLAERSSQPDQFFVWWRRFRERPGSSARPDVSEDCIEGSDRSQVERRRQEDRDIQVAAGHQDPAEDRRHAVRQAPDDRVHRARQPALLRRDDPHQERIANRRGHVNQSGPDQIEPACGERVRDEREAEHEDRRGALSHDDRPHRAVSPREGGADRCRETDRDVREGEERAAPRVRHAELQEEPRRHQRDEESGAEADEAVDAGELEERFPIHPLRPRLARADRLVNVPEKDVQRDRHDEPEAVRDDQRGHVDRMAVDPGPLLDERERQGQHEPNPREDVVQDEREGERGTSLLRRRLVGDDRVPRR